ncbi:MAG TPA: hypothetical protein VF406_20350, partial [Thermodesulfobacteriota bacterium]
TKIGTVVSSDLPRLAQLVPGGEVRFEVVDLADAYRAAREAEAALDAALARVARADGPPPWAASHRLLARNLISGAVAAGEEP